MFAETTRRRRGDNVYEYLPLVESCAAAGKSAPFHGLRSRRQITANRRRVHLTICRPLQDRTPTALGTDNCTWNKATIT